MLLDSKIKQSLIKLKTKIIKKTKKSKSPRYLTKKFLKKYQKPKKFKKDIKLIPDLIIYNIESESNIILLTEISLKTLDKSEKHYKYKLFEYAFK